MSASSDADLYDPDRHENQIIAVYQTRRDAEVARDHLVDIGITAGALQVIDQGDTTTTTSPARGDEGLWGAVKNLFAPEDDVRDYHHAVGRGHAILVVTTTTGMDRQRIMQALDASNPIDFDMHANEWRQSGYPGATLPVAGMGAATGTGMHATGMAEAPASFGTTAPAAGRADETLKVVQEQLRIGKREVTQGAVRLRSYVVERPMEEQVRLREERVTVQRRPVDAPVSAADESLFQERTLEARATTEEAVVSKEARVVEEVGLHRDTTERTETVRDTVRETKVDVDDQTHTTGLDGTTTGTARPAPGTTPR